MEGVFFRVEILENAEELAVRHFEYVLRGVGTLHIKLNSSIVLGVEEVKDRAHVHILKELLVVHWCLLLCATLPAERQDAQVELARWMDATRTLSLGNLTRSLTDIVLQLFVDSCEYPLEGFDSICLLVDHNLTIAIDLSKKRLLQNVNCKFIVFLSVDDLVAQC